MTTYNSADPMNPIVPLFIIEHINQQTNDFIKDHPDLWF